MMGKTELAMPAGNLQCALYAFKGGADAVYLGMKLFSARAGAVNFSFEDLRKLKTICNEQNKKFYITLNTLVKNQDLNEVYRLLRELEFLHPDGVIVQDLGIVNIIRRDFPSLELHGSTQLAVHTVEGVKELQDLGFKRVVLARELSFSEIEHIRKECPDIELKVFIHGALCYGFSGLCMASQKITGRSANCGTCAQICRTWFTCRETQEDSWFFSMKDLALGQNVQSLQNIGIDSLKVEGRMKGPEYVYWCSKYYRLLLDGKTEQDEEVKFSKQAMSLAFSRSTTTGFFDTENNGSTNCQMLVSPDYPSHRGICVGAIKKVLNGKATVSFSEPVSLHDGLLVISQNRAQGFALTKIDSPRSFVSAGETATINFPSEKFSKTPASGTKVMCISRHNANLPLLNENIALYKKGKDIDIEVTDKALIINGKNYPLEVQKANKMQNLETLLRQVFDSSDKSYFKVGNFKVKNSSGFDQVFLMLSSLKQIRRTFYEQCDKEFEEYLVMEKQYPSFEIGGYKVPHNALHLKSVFFDEEAYFDSIEKLNPELVGINNVAQIRWAKKHPDVRVFADAFMYVKNSEALALLKQELPNLEGCISEDETDVPLFISRVCFRHNSLGLPCNGCSKNNTFHISQNSGNYKVICKDCMTEVYSL